MIDVKEILDKHFKQCHDIHKVTIPDKYIPYINSAIREIIKEVLKEAADSAEVKEICEPNDQPSSSFGDDYYYIINKESITSVIDKVKF